MQNNSENTPGMLVMVQLIEISRALASNDVVQRNKQLRKLYKWLHLRSKSSFPFQEEDFMRLWRGLYYNMWYSDKPLVQEQVAENTAQLLYAFQDKMMSVDFFMAFMKTMNNEWFGIDQWRMDKFLLLVRRMLRHMFHLFKSCKWSLELLSNFNRQSSYVLLANEVQAKGLTLHYMDIFMEELAKVADGNITAMQVNQFVMPFAKYLINQKEFDLVQYCRTRIFYHLLYQSELGREYTEKYNAWKEMGFPTSNIDDLELVEEEGEKLEEEGNAIGEDDKDKDKKTANDTKQLNQTNIDPRAGNVDVFMPLLPFNASIVINMLESSDCIEMSMKRRKFIRGLVNVLTIYQNGEFPLGVKRISSVSERKPLAPLVEQKVDDLDALEDEVYGVNRKLKQLNKRQRRQLLKSLNYNEMTAENMDETIDSMMTKKSRKVVKVHPLKVKPKSVLMNDWSELPLDKQDFLIRKKQLELLADYTSAVKMKKTLKRLKSQSAVECKQLAATNGDGRGDEKFASPLKKKVKINSEWRDESLKEGEKEIFLPSRKVITNKHNNMNMKKKQMTSSSTNSQNQIAIKLEKKNDTGDLEKGKDVVASTSTKPKRVRIALNHNTSQKPHEYIQQIKSSPNVPYDASKKPVKGVLKANALPSPINPFYKLKIRKYFHGNR